MPSLTASAGISCIDRDPISDQSLQRQHAATRRAADHPGRPRAVHGAGRYVLCAEVPGLGLFHIAQGQRRQLLHGRSVTLSHYRCRTRSGPKGRCNRSVSRYRCTERRTTIPTEINGRVTCKRGSRASSTRISRTREGPRCVARARARATDHRRGARRCRVATAPPRAIRSAPAATRGWRRPSCPPPTRRRSRRTSRARGTWPTRARTASPPTRRRRQSSSWGTATPRTGAVRWPR